MYREYMKMAVIVIFYALFIGATLITTAVGRWLVFNKMGLPGWNGIIPFYSENVLFRKLWNIKLFWAYLALFAGYCTLCIIAPVLGFSELFRQLPPIIRASFFMFILFAAIGALVSAFVILFKLNNRLARAFGRIPGFAVGLTFIPPVFFMILGLSKSEYNKSLSTT